MVYRDECTVAEQMICEMARLIGDNNTVFHGVSSHMPLLAVLLAKQTHAPNAVHLNIPGGVDPQKVNISSYTSAGRELMDDACATFQLMDVFDLAMRGRLDVAFLSGIQFDVNGNVNASVIGDYAKPKVRMPGGAGSAVLIPTAKKTIIWRTKHDKRTFVQKVDFVTTRGNIHRVVTPYCVFKYENGRLALDTVHAHSSFEEVHDNTAFVLDASNVMTTPKPTSQMLDILNRLDTEGFREIEF